MAIIENLSGMLPGWQLIVFIGFVLTCLLIGGIVTFRILSKLRWPYTYITLENISGRGYSISSRKGTRARMVSFGDGGEEVFLLKGNNKKRIGYGKRIGTNQIGWAIGEDGYWYQFSFGDFDKKLRELGVIPVSVNVRYAMASLRKGIDKRYEDKTWMEKFGPILYFGLFVLILLIFAGIIWYTMNKQVEIAQLTAQNVNVTKETMDLAQKTLNAIANLRNNYSVGIGGSGLTPAV